MALIKSSYLILNPHKGAINWFSVNGHNCDFVHRAACTLSAQAKSAYIS
jgi:hypothetical protein